MRAGAKIWEARASEHSRSTRLNFATVKNFNGPFVTPFIVEKS